LLRTEKRSDHERSELSPVAFERCRGRAGLLPWNEVFTAPDFMSETGGGLTGGNP